MSRRGAVNSAEGFTMDADAYKHMVDSMMELAMRGSKEEGLVMRIAKAGGIAEVTKQLGRLRVYAKKQGLIRAPRAASGLPAPGKGSKRSKKRTRANNGNADEGQSSNAA